MSNDASEVLSIQEIQGVLVLTITREYLEGDEMSRSLRTALLQAVSSAKTHDIVLDFHRTRYVSSLVFPPLLSLRRKLQEIGGRLLLCGLSNVVADVFHTTRLITRDGSFEPVFEIAVDVPAAIAQFSGSSMATTAPLSMDADPKNGAPAS